MLSRYDVSNPLLPLWGVPSRYAFGVDELMRQLFTDVDPTLQRAVAAAGRRNRQRIQLRDTGEAVQVLVDLPGFRMQDIELTIEGNAVSLRATAPASSPPEGFRLVHREREPRNVEWSFEAPYALDVNAATATLQHGQLSVTLPKAPEAKPRSIPVKAA
jgi:HSP20 family protein